MTHPMIAWCLIVVVLSAACLLWLVGQRIAACRHNRKFGHIVESGRECDIFFVPGDCDDDDDL